MEFLTDERIMIVDRARVHTVASRAVRVAACAMIGVGSVFGGAAFLGSPTAAAQEASPAAGEFVEATECQVEPLSDDYLSGIAATPEGEATESAATPEPFTAPEGEPAGEAEVEGVTMTVRELVACLNAADFRRVYALYTDDYLAMNFAGEQADAAQATPQPDESATQNALIGVSDVIVLEDGRVGAQADLVGSDALQVTMYMIFENVDDRWLIDEVRVLDSAPQEDGADNGAEDGGTPTS